MGKRWAIVIGVGAAAVMALGGQSATATFPGPDGLISFTRFSPKVSSAEIHVARPDGSEVQKLTSNPRHFSLNSDWSRTDS